MGQRKKKEESGEWRTGERMERRKKAARLKHRPMAFVAQAMHGPLHWKS